MPNLADAAAVYAGTVPALRAYLGASLVWEAETGPPPGTVIHHATFEAGLDNHQPWFGTTLSQDTSAAHSGTASLLVELDGQFTGVQLDNYPYIGGVAGGQGYELELWYLEAGGVMPTVNWNIQWYDASTTLLRTDTVPIVRATTWTKAATSVTAPAGAATVGWTFTTNTSGSGGPKYRIDDLLIREAG
ncbi:hypothetical protein Psed_5783 [Pseudonocardia dioxanivorans CB1190]|uniref:CBM-cenC domain-containing protein n=1 Tax=Pseudonocardia dioxanivorans (strain ATCC 55486 / DSM 44775 / JCM 13855 / CB1190) TaxID=675635 RepID=F4D1C2_PSEUX|nr:hypothetical protein [Pseudonocardia dioxanivorans]AEA27910.1 hypothetical protein Psed_5783 [Pseudonocardia dioxanivorans CB1190]